MSASDRSVPGQRTSIHAQSSSALRAILAKLLEGPLGLRSGINSVESRLRLTYW